ncbi:3734_t:CDS:2, partial [Funneliformis geosporum]
KLFRKYSYPTRCFKFNNPPLAQIPQYVRVAVFNNAVKTNVLAGKMAGRFIPSNPFNNSIENAVNTLALFIT